MILLLHRCNFERLALVNRKIRALTHTVTHTGKRAYGNNGDKMLRNHSIMSGKAPKAHEISVFGVLTTLRNHEVIGPNPISSSTQQQEAASHEAALLVGRISGIFKGTPVPQG